MDRQTWSKEERLARRALAAVAQTFPCTFPTAWSGHSNINHSVALSDVPQKYVDELMATLENNEGETT